MTPHRWTYPAQLVRIIDGDTIVCRLDLGFRMFSVMPVRLAGVDTPEIRGPERPAGLIAKDFVEDWMQVACDPILDWPLLIESEKLGKYGRPIGTIERMLDGECLNARLLMEGLAT